MADLQSAELPVSQGTRSMMTLFGGEDRDTMPLWFNKGPFTTSDFSSEAYVVDLRKFMPLDTLRTELHSHLRLLKGKLVELINKEYADFVNLSTKLVDVDGAVLRMRTPLNDLKSRVSLVKDSVKASLSALQDGLHHRVEASQAREILELLLDTSHVVSKIEKLLLELKRMPHEGSTTSQSDKMLLQCNFPLGFCYITLLVVFSLATITHTYWLWVALAQYKLLVFCYSYLSHTHKPSHMQKPLD